MKQRFLRTCVLLAVVLTLATTAWAATVTWSPPAQTGDIYTVINYKWGGLGTAQKTAVSVFWGTFTKSGSFSPPSTGTCGLQRNAGIVLKLRHLTADSVPLTITTDGTIVSGPNQGAAPAQWNNSCYQRVSW